MAWSELVLRGFTLIGGLVSLSAGLAAAAFVAYWLLDMSLTRVAKTLGYTRLFFIFAVRRLRNAKGAPAPIFVEDCRPSVQALVDYALENGVDPDAWGRTSIAVRKLRFALNEEMPA